MKGRRELDVKSAEAVGYVAFLRGINVGGNKPVKMEDLRRTFEGMGFAGAKTVLASGNVLFQSSQMPVVELENRIEAGLKRRLGVEIGVVVREIAALQRLFDADPFKAIEVTPDVRLYVTFLPHGIESTLKTPFKSAGGDFQIIRATEGEVCSVLTVSPGHGTPDFMTFLDKRFGRRITTRSWNTLTKILNQSQ